MIEPVVLQDVVTAPAGVQFAVAMVLLAVGGAFVFGLWWFLLAEPAGAGV